MFIYRFEKEKKANQNVSITNKCYAITESQIPGNVRSCTNNQLLLNSIVYTFFLVLNKVTDDLFGD